MSMSLDQLTAAIRESSKTLNVNSFKEDDEKAPSIQSSFVDSIELSNRAVELSIGADTETNQGQGEATQQQEQVYEPINVLA